MHFFVVVCSGGVMIYFDRIEVVNMLVPLAGNNSSDLVMKKVEAELKSTTLTMSPSFFSGGHCEELHCRL